VLIRHLWQRNTVVFQHRCLICSVLIIQANAALFVCLFVCVCVSFFHASSISHTMLRLSHIAILNTAHAKAWFLNVTLSYINFSLIFDHCYFSFVI
jgi:hypothetical protein